MYFGVCTALSDTTMTSAGAPVLPPSTACAVKEHNVLCLKLAFCHVRNLVRLAVVRHCRRCRRGYEEWPLHDARWVTLASA